MQDEVDKLLELINKKHYKNLIFDFDETLTILNLPWDKWSNEVIAAIPESKRREVKKILEDEYALWGQVINEYIKKDDNFYKKFLKISLDFETKYFSHTPYYKLIEVLPKLKSEGCNLYIWTSNMRPTAEKTLLELGVFQLFQKIVTREDIKLGKPDLEGWLLIKDASQSLGSYLFVGDSDNDKNAAIKASIDYFPITYFKA